MGQRADTRRSAGATDAGQPGHARPEAAAQRAAPAPERRPRASRTRKRADGEGTISRHATSGMWRGRLMVGRRADGRPDVREVYAKSQAECRWKLDELKRTAAGGLVVARHRLTVGDALADWLRDGDLRGLRPNTLASYRRIVRSYLAPTLRRHKLAELGPEHVRRLLADLVERGLSAATVRYARVCLRGALQLAVRQERVARNVADLVRPPRRKRPPLTPPTPAETARLLDAAAAGDDRLAALWVTAVFAGCRPNELLALHWEDVDFERGRVTIRRNLVRVAGRAPTIAEPKTDRGRRTLRLDDEAMEALRAHRRRQRAERLLLGPDYDDHGLVFCTHDGAPLIYRNVTRAFKRVVARAGLPATTRLYDLRHANATAMLKAGVHPKSAAERLGHSGTTLFMDTYAHMLEELDADAAFRLGRAIRGPDRVAGGAGGAGGR